MRSEAPYEQTQLAVGFALDPEPGFGPLSANKAVRKRTKTLLASGWDLRSTVQVGPAGCGGKLGTGSTLAVFGPFETAGHVHADRRLVACHA